MAVGCGGVGGVRLSYLQALDTACTRFQSPAHGRSTRGALLRPGATGDDGDDDVDDDDAAEEATAAPAATARRLVVLSVRPVSR
jgi:hypothetical protein